jgi:hypothetical protein
LNQLEISFGTPLRIVVAREPEQLIYSVLTLWYAAFKATFKGDVMYTLPVDHTVQMKVSYVDAGNNPAVVDGPVVWSSSDDALATVLADSADSSLVTVTPVGPIGQVQITATADADLGTGVRSLVTISDITLVAGEAVAGTIAPVGVPTQHS